MKITKSQLRQIVKEALEEEMDVYDPEMTVEGLMEVIEDLDKILLKVYQVHGDIQAHTAHHKLDKILGR